MIHPSVKIDETIRIFFKNPGGTDVLEIGEGSRIDAYTVITVGPKGIKIGNNVHIGCFCFLSGSGGRIEIGDGCSLSPRSTIYTACDDFRKKGLIGPTNPRDKRNVIEGDVVMEEGSALGHGAILLPKSTLKKGAALGAYMCLHGELPEGVLSMSNYDVIHRERL